MKKISLEQFIEELRTIRYFQPDGDPDPDWLLVLGKTWTAARVAVADAAKAVARVVTSGSSSDSSWDAARTAAWNAAKIAASDAGRNAEWESAWDSARDVTRETAWASARSEAPDSAWAVPWDAAWHAADYAAICVVCSDLKIQPEHFQTIERRMNVWRKGYALMAEIHGTLYVYAAQTTTHQTDQS
jgi:hypothetical protein